MGETVRIDSRLPSNIRTGEVLGSKYRLERELGRGSMGTVWAATHLTLGQRVAVKFIAADRVQAPEARLRFRREAKAVARLKSRHVVQVYDDGETPEGMPYIVMEYLEGETLEARLQRERGLHLVDAVRITGQVAKALARAHAQSIIHRDLKPGNIFLARSDDDELGWVAKVLDFGVAKIEEPSDKSTTKPGAMLGTPLFMSPEQIRAASNVDFRTDLYSLGICFYNMLTGRSAFDRGSFGDILLSICSEPLPDLKQAAPFVPDAVAEWFKRCCAREPAERFQSADELVDRLQAAIGGGVLLVPRGKVPDDFRGPFGTLRGHAAPLAPKTRVISTDGSGHAQLLASDTQLSPGLPAHTPFEGPPPYRAPDAYRAEPGFGGAPPAALGYAGATPAPAGYATPAPAGYATPASPAYASNPLPPAFAPSPASLDASSRDSMASLNDGPRKRLLSQRNVLAISAGAALLLVLLLLLGVAWSGRSRPAATALTAASAAQPSLAESSSPPTPAQNSASAAPTPDKDPTTAAPAVSAPVVDAPAVSAPETNTAGPSSRAEVSAAPRTSSREGKRPTATPTSARVPVGPPKTHARAAPADLGF